ncbi:MAG: NAD+ synthase [Phycisphaerales bacterium]|jgi:NAD+ synthetase|nr:NAD+ synthase [Phycisphaerales bacterium]
MIQLNPLVGDITGNTDKLIKSVNLLDSDLIVSPEMSICGYPPRDLLNCSGFVQACEEAVQKLAEICTDKTLIVGHPRVDAATNRLRNSISVLQKGEISYVYDKQLLPSYDVFDEKRYFDSGEDICTFELCGEKIGVAICEDFWRGFDASSAPTYDINPVNELLEAGCTILISPSASPFVTGKRDTHLQYAMELASEKKITAVVCNQVGGNDDLIFDGGSFICSPKGLLGQLPVFETGATTVDISSGASDIATTSDDQERYRALVLGTKDYFIKTGHQKAILGLSGGIDSALTATIAVAALGAQNVTGVLMPSRYSSLGSIEDAEQLAVKLGIMTMTLPIGYMHSGFERTLEDDNLDISGIAGENAQARIRGLLLMALSNQSSSLLLATGNKSELAVGYTTLYGDMDGAISVIGDIYKTDVWSLSNWINKNYNECGFELPPIPQSTITKPPSAELRPNQLDQDSLPEYDELDEVLRLLVDLDLGIDDIEEKLNVKREFISKIIKMVDISQFKRDQAAVILKTSPRAFGRGRRLPIVMKRSWTTSRETS